MPSLTKVQPAFILAQGAIELDSGTASAPSLKFATSSATGMFSPSTGALAFSTGSTQNALSILANGNVGIGTTNPTNKLDVVGSIIASGSVSAAGASGFYSTTFVTNARNPIWRFANADGFGVSYFQGSAGVSPAGGGDTIGFHFGTPTAAASSLQLNHSSGAVINGTLGVTGAITATLVGNASSATIVNGTSGQNISKDDRIIEPNSISTSRLQFGLLLGQIMILHHMQIIYI